MSISRWVALFAVASTLGGAAAADDEPDELVAAKLVVVRPGKLLKFLAKGSIPMPSPANDPTVAGATLAVFDTTFGGAGQSVSALPASGWRALASGGFRYKGGPADPCRTVLLRPTRIKATCGGAAVALAPPFAGEVGVVLTAGSASKRYCASAGGSERRNDAGGTKRADAPAPASCPTTDLGARQCAIASGGPGRWTPSLFIDTAALPLPLASSGSLDISCGSPAPDGSASCTCAVAAFAPYHIPEIGDVCLYPAGPCPSGKIDCDGGAAADVDLLAAHDIGACASNASCAASCATLCAGMGASYSVLASGCEGFCQGGNADESACTTDSQCPAGSCVGGRAGAPPHPGRCNCQCDGNDLGAPAPAGTLTCSLGVRVTMEIPGDNQCGNNPVVLDSGPLCVSLTTGSSVAVLTDANRASGVTIPVGGAETRVGAPLSCAAFNAGSMSGLQLVGGSFAAFDQTLGDVLTRGVFACQ